MSNEVFVSKHKVTTFMQMVKPIHPFSAEMLREQVVFKFSDKHDYARAEIANATIMNFNNNN
jgi:hypothetical protein